MFLAILFVFLTLSSLLARVPIVEGSVMLFVLLLTRLLFMFVFRRGVGGVGVCNAIVATLTMSGVVGNVVT